MFIDTAAAEGRVTMTVEGTDNQIYKIKYTRSHSVSSASAFSITGGEGEGLSHALPNIKVLGTGGTIASKGASSHQTAGYEVDLTIEDLIQLIPDLSTTCNLQYEQVMNLDLKEMGDEEVLSLYHKIVEDLPHYDGFVITHGTDTMEETAFFLQMTINTYKPIVLCGSMRPSTAISSDGPMNLYQAIAIAASQQSRNRGVLVALNDRIGSGFYITKSNANSLDTFKSNGQGYVGNFVNNEIHYYWPASKPLGVMYFNLESVQAPIQTLPKVCIIYAHQGFDNELIDVLVTQFNAKGMVLATMGAGSMNQTTNERLYHVTKNNKIPIIYSKRSMDGMVPTGSLPKIQGFDNAIASGYLNPQKSRILLQLCLLNGYSVSEIKGIFQGVYGG
ncbi:uncharacterized protein KQ657_002684 [Scheffersomyces spartinae]|uniref:asparaginase n=1 Tax=Scheffersomyces spartinae TaxID=45513 RepID=A0A9P7V659_9ASCO|nr:uncharacterized protein KQ657_002684 [Scheffersomyces spartinae]KAG7191895.1 hypothetical protein KQ657_002684 [Scheffersomyces spartinae]